LETRTEREFPHSHSDGGGGGTLSEKYAQARAENDLDSIAVVCGEAVGLLRDRPTAGSVINSMVAQAGELLHKDGTLNFT